MKGRHFSSDAEVIPAAETWLDGQLYEFFFLNRLQKLEFGRCSLFPSWSGLRTYQHPGIIHYGPTVGLPLRLCYGTDGFISAVRVGTKYMLHLNCGYVLKSLSNGCTYLASILVFTALLQGGGELRAKNVDFDFVSVSSHPFFLDRAVVKMFLKNLQMLPTRGPEIHFETPKTVRENSEK